MYGQNWDEEQPGYALLSHAAQVSAIALMDARLSTQSCRGSTVPATQQWLLKPLETHSMHQQRQNEQDSKCQVHSSTTVDAEYTQARQHDAEYTHSRLHQASRCLGSPQACQGGACLFGDELRAMVKHVQPSSISPSAASQPLALRPYFPIRPLPLFPCSCQPPLPFCCHAPLLSHLWCIFSFQCSMLNFLLLHECSR